MVYGTDRHQDIDGQKESLYDINTRLIFSSVFLVFLFFFSSFWLSCLCCVIVCAVLCKEGPCETNKNGNAALMCDVITSAYHERR